jgi:hypothetical protein
MKKILAILIPAIAFTACSKDKFKTQPTVEIKSLGPDVVMPGNTFTLQAIVRDKEGDLQDSVIFYRKRYNTQNVLLTTDSLTRYNLDDFGVPTNSEIELQLAYSYGPQDRRPTYNIYNYENNDTYLSFGIVVKDKAGNRSDLVETNKILLKKP